MGMTDAPENKRTHDISGRRERNEKGKQISTFGESSEKGGLRLCGPQTDGLNEYKCRIIRKIKCQQYNNVAIPSLE